MKRYVKLVVTFDASDMSGYEAEEFAQRLADELSNEGALASVQNAPGFVDAKIENTLEVELH